MKIALITDSHFGARSDSFVYDKFFKKFYKNIFFPELEKRNIDTVIHLGDVFDRRKFINYVTLKSCKKYFFDELEKRDITVHVLTGNHDTTYKNSNEINSPDILLMGYSNITTYSDPVIANIGGLNILMMPWICAANYEQSLKLIKDEGALVCMGHFEFSGFEMYRGQVSEGGMDASLFQNYKLVCSGHYHHKSSKKNITYLGNPYQITWQDYGDSRGFHILDTETLELEFIENPYTIFEKIYYNDVEVDYNKSMVSEDNYTNKNIKLIVVNKKDAYLFDKFVDWLYSIGPLDLKIIEDFSEFESQVEDESVSIEDTMSLLGSYVDAIETDMNKEKIKTILKTLYVEAQTFEE
jgi:DNA repair exonuclease SbcCD nuclease subunit